MNNPSQYSRSGSIEHLGHEIALKKYIEHLENDS